jgi:hypothetical protein
MDFCENELMKTNTSLSAFTGEVTDTQGVMSVELMVGSKTMVMMFFVVDVKEWYNLLLRKDWIHSNGRVPPALHQCLIQWIGDEVEVVMAKEHVLVVMTEASGAAHDGQTTCLPRRDLSNYDYISVSKDGLVPVSVKPMRVTRLNCISDQ